MIPADLLDRFARIALSHVEREYPNKLDHVMNSDSDVQCPKALHPIFYGSFDWHSCVHGYWTLATVLRLRPEGPFANEIENLFSRSLTVEKVEAERAYAAAPSSRGFERPYGWAWCLMLAAELFRHGAQRDAAAVASGTNEDAAASCAPNRHHAPWSLNLKPLADVFRQRWLDYLPLATYPVRTGVHSNSAFAARLSLEYAREVGDPELESALHEKLWKWHHTDRDAQAWEPSNDDFLSPALTVAQAIAYAGPRDKTAAWLSEYFPRFHERQPSTLFQPVSPSDRSDGKIAHLDGLNLSRAFALYELAGQFLGASQQTALVAAQDHLDAGLGQVQGDYMGEHWLASFALLALRARAA